MSTAAVTLYWLPLGAGGRCVRLDGRAYEAIAARLGRRPACDLYHSALTLDVPALGRVVVEQTPVPDDHGSERGVVAVGPVGARVAGRLRIFRYELRRWHDGCISDIAEAVDSPRRLSVDPDAARRIWSLVPEVPALTWGRDELGAGERWNSNSMVAWLLARGGLEPQSILPPRGGRAPGWGAGIVAARRTAGGRAAGNPHARRDGLPDELAGHLRDAAGVPRRHASGAPGTGSG